MLQVAQSANLALRFMLEVGALVSLSYWGFHLAAPASLRTLLGVGAPLTAAIAWGLLAAPHAAIALPGPAKAVVQTLILGSAAAGLVHAGRIQAAALFGAIAVVNAALLTVWSQ